MNSFEEIAPQFFIVLRSKTSFLGGGNITDFKEIAYFAVSLIIAAFIITIVATLGITTGQMAFVRNGEIQAADNLRLARNYAAFNNQLVLGSDIIALMRENTMSNVTLDIFVDRDIFNSSMTMNAGNRGNFAWRLANLTQRIRADTVYRAILVYGGENPVTAVHINNPGGSAITGVRFNRN